MDNFQDPKYQFRDEGIWHRQNCYWLPKSEPVVLFRGKDTGTIVALDAYIRWLHTLEQSDIARDHINSATERLRAIELYQKTHPELIGQMCSTHKS